MDRISFKKLSNCESDGVVMRAASQQRLCLPSLRGVHASPQESRQQPSHGNLLIREHVSTDDAPIARMAMRSQATAPGQRGPMDKALGARRQHRSFARDAGAPSDAGRNRNARDRHEG